MPTVPVSQEEFRRFHTIDRDLYSLLVFVLFRDPAESMRVLGLWLWLEQKGFHSIIKRMLTLPHFLINELADEAVTCFTLLTTPDNLLASLDLNITSLNDSPLIQCLMKNDITFQFFKANNRQNSAQEFTNIVEDVCYRAFSDLMHQAILLETSSQNHNMVLPTMSFHSNFRRAGLHFGGGSSSGSSGGTTELNGSSLSSSSSSSSSVPAVVVPPDDRTMFVTFSKGYHVYEWEVREFFTRTYGDCIESLHMQEVQPTEQSLFARIVFYSAATIDVILDGHNKAKFTINGKHVWMRKFVPKRTKSQLLPPLPNLPASLLDD